MSFDAFWFSGGKAAIMIVVALLFALLLAAVSNAIKNKWGNKDNSPFFADYFFAAMPFGVLGIVAGFLTGVSRSPAVAELIPAILTFLGGIAVFLLTKGDKVIQMSGIAIFSFSTLLLFGSLAGSLERANHDAFVSSLDTKKRDVDIEFGVRQYRKGLGLPLEPAVTKSDSRMDQSGP